MKVAKGIKLANEARAGRQRALLDRIARTNSTGYPDDVVLAILKAKHGRWSQAMAGEDLLASMGIQN